MKVYFKKKKKKKREREREKKKKKKTQPLEAREQMESLDSRRIKMDVRSR